MTLTFNPTTYLGLLANNPPKAIKTEQEYDRALNQFEPLHFNKNRTPEENALCELLAILIEDYEKQHYPMPTSAPHEILQHILESSGLSQVDLVELAIGSPEIVSEIVDGQRPISQAQAEVLSNHFKLSPSLFL